MTILHVLFWLSTAIIVYTYILYPLLVAVIAKKHSHPIQPKAQFTGSVSVIIPFYNEEPFIARRLDELNQILAATGLDAEIIAVSDGSTDKSTMIAKTYTERRECEQVLSADLSERRALANDMPKSGRTKRVRLIELINNSGKAEALTRGCSIATGDVIVFADARQRWAPDALENLLKNFTDPTVGGVSGDLIIQSSPGLLSGVGKYWQYEKWIRRNESLIHSSVGVTGAISAVRRKLFRPIPMHTLLDDVYWPMQVVMQGYRIVHEENAKAYDQLPEKTGDEFRRKVRTLTGNFQLLVLLPAILKPWRNPIWFQCISHKIMRLLVPWALLSLLILSALLTEPLYRLALFIQLAFYILGMTGISRGGKSNIRMASAAGSFIVLNTAAWLAFWVWLTGKATITWRQVAYRTF